MILILWSISISSIGTQKKFKYKSSCKEIHKIISDFLFSPHYHFLSAKDTSCGVGILAKQVHAAVVKRLETPMETA